MTQHNEKVQVEFILAGINFQKWLNYGVEERIEAIEYKVSKDKDTRWQVLQFDFDCLLRLSENTPLYGSIRKDCIEIQKKKALIFSGGYVIPQEWSGFIFLNIIWRLNISNRSNLTEAWKPLILRGIESS